MTRAISIALLHPIVAAFDPENVTWQADCQAAADQVYGSLGAALGDSLTDGQFNAVVDLVYTATFTAFDGSTLQRLLRAGNLAMATYEFEKWVYGPDPVTGQPTVLSELVNRRLADKALWLA